MTKERPSSLDDISGRRLTDEEVDYLLAMMQRDDELMQRIRNGYPLEERYEFGQQFLDAARRHIPGLGLAQAGEALGSIVIKVRGLKQT